MNESTLEWSGPDLLDLAPVARADGDLLALDASGGLHCIDLRSGQATRLGAVELPAQTIENPGAFGLDSRWRLHASADGEFAALVFDGGRQGLVVDLAPFRVALRLDGGDYYQNTVPFSACFLSFQGDTVLVHRTAWNRLDASDPRSGRLLTARGPTSYENGERPPHYLDYFHGLLRPSPSGTLLFDAGWVWQPAGVPCVFDAAAWLASNVWESEDGASKRRLVLRDDWNLPACWIDDDHIALGGIAQWDEEEAENVAAPAGVRIVDVRQGTLTPDRIVVTSAEPKELFSDGRSLFATLGGDTAIWSLGSGECVTVLSGFAATHHHPRCRMLLQALPRRIRFVALD
ncbi:hypothetical protein [Lysobacter enzymogenes]|uniref:Uncharacterized protein n=1 Tax=Lysobacter enzymogenes TaxID=69 RepID=A0AAU9AH72_LYSEN|nr:hypothetical protein [Lysobacter enzymogenes]BAV98061.1 conserved hypothetical protein [Lysobacter enzymogenes]